MPSLVWTQDATTNGLRRRRWIPRVFVMTFTATRFIQPAGFRRGDVLRWRDGFCLRISPKRVVLVAFHG